LKKRASHAYLAVGKYKITNEPPINTPSERAIYDINGKQVFNANKGFNVGYNEVMLTKSIFQTTGIYFYRLTTDKYSVVKKLQFVAE
jgi:hypothetical protein